MGHGRNALGIEIQPGDGVVALGLGRLLLHGDDLAVGVKFHDAEALRVVDIVAEHRRPAVLLRVRLRLPQDFAKAVAVENIVAQHHGAGLVADKVLPQQEGLGQPIRRGLHHIAQVQPELAAVAQQVLKPGRILWRGNNQYVPYPRQHQRGKGVVDHRLVVDRKQLLRGHHGQWI